MCLCQFSFCFSVLSVKVNILILSVCLYFVSDLATESRNTGTSFQLTIFCLSDRFIVQFSLA
jgi:ABC-type protease/lipase transport system fused ATPase/permease subunit